MSYENVCVRFRSTVGGTMLVPDELRPMLMAEAKRTETSITNVVTRVLAERYGVEVESAARAGRDPDPDAPSLKVRLPTRLHEAISRAAGDHYPDRRSIPDEIRDSLCAHYGLAPVGRRVRVAA